MSENILFKFGKKLINPLLVSRISVVNGQRGSYSDRKIYRSSKNVPYRKEYGRVHHPLYSKIYWKQPWHVRFFMDLPNVASWNEAKVIVWDSSHEKYAILLCEDNQHASEIYVQAMKNWTEALYKFTIKLDK